MSKFINEFAVPNLQTLISNFSAQDLGRARVNELSLDPAHHAVSQSMYSAVKKLSQALTQNQINDERKLGMVAGLSNLLRCATHRVLAERSLQEMITANDLEISEVSHQSPIFSKCLGDGSKSRLLKLESGKSNSLYIEINGIEQTQVLVRGIGLGHSPWIYTIIGSSASTARDLVPVQILFKNKDIDGLQSLFDKIGK